MLMVLPFKGTTKELFKQLGNGSIDLDYAVLRLLGLTIKAEGNNEKVKICCIGDLSGKDDEVKQNLKDLNISKQDLDKIYIEGHGNIGEDGEGYAGLDIRGPNVRADEISQALNQLFHNCEAVTEKDVKNSTIIVACCHGASNALETKKNIVQAIQKDVKGIDDKKVIGCKEVCKPVLSDNTLLLRMPVKDNKDDAELIASFTALTYPHANRIRILLPKKFSEEVKKLNDSKDVLGKLEWLKQAVFNVVSCQHAPDLSDELQDKLGILKDKDGNSINVSEHKELKTKFERLVCFKELEESIKKFTKEAWDKVFDLNLNSQLKQNLQSYNTQFSNIKDNAETLNEDKGRLENEIEELNQNAQLKKEEIEKLDKGKKQVEKTVEQRNQDKELAAKESPELLEEKTQKLNEANDLLNKFKERLTTRNKELDDIQEQLNKANQNLVATKKQLNETAEELNKLVESFESQYNIKAEELQIDNMGNTGDVCSMWILALKQLAHIDRLLDKVEKNKFLKKEEFKQGFFNKSTYIKDLKKDIYEEVEKMLPQSGITKYQLLLENDAKGYDIPILNLEKEIDEINKQLSDISRQLQEIIKQEKEKIRIANKSLKKSSQKSLEYDSIILELGANDDTYNTLFMNQINCQKQLRQKTQELELEKLTFPKVVVTKLFTENVSPLVHNTFKLDHPNDDMCKS